MFVGCVPIGFIPDKKWRPSIHMPRQYSRLTLELTDVRLQRLQDISKEDAKAEGIHEFRLPNGSCYGYDPKGTPGKMMADEITHAYYLLWESLHGADSVAENPEVIALTFRVHHCNVDEFIKQKTA